MKLLIINGPNLNLLGLREPHIYGTQNYAALCSVVEDTCAALGTQFEIYQSNHEGAIVDKIQEAYGVFDGIVINPAAYTHTSVAILDALKAVSIPTVEVHISDINSREPFRKFSYVSLIAIKTFAGHGIEGYKMALEYLVEHLKGN
ncbi:MAG: type II 3-dehydroquinate dehydratase [Ruminococcaceae bacterium]|nr:type II 3-dehydroquinate dehydratase [Oscillospiraceae bacterium]